jgi:uncharacterized Zn-binding protein involved in type VI secretion
MGQAQCRIGDFGIGVCTKHGSYVTTFSNGAETVMVNSLSAATMVTIGISSCGDPTIVISGSPGVKMEGQSSHRTGDEGINTGTYQAVIGSSNSIMG